MEPGLEDGAQRHGKSDIRTGADGGALMLLSSRLPFLRGR